jgi:hypothetical protein
MMSAA